MMETSFYEEFKVRGKDSFEHTFLEIPLTVAAVGAIVAPVANFTLVVERAGEPPNSAPPPSQ